MPNVQKLQNVPATPHSGPLGKLGTFIKLAKRSIHIGNVIDGLSHEYKIGDRTATGKEFTDNDGFLLKGIRQFVGSFGGPRGGGGVPEAPVSNELDSGEVKSIENLGQMENEASSFPDSHPPINDQMEDELEYPDFDAIISELSQIENELFNNPDSDELIEKLSKMEEDLSHPEFNNGFGADDGFEADFDFSIDDDLDFGAPDYSDGGDEGPGGGGAGGDNDFIYLNKLSLDQPEQWTMGWTTYANVYEDGQKMKSTWVSTLTNADEATKHFWPTIATYGLVYNLLVLEKVDETKHDQLKKTFNFHDELDKDFVKKLDDLQKIGKLYVIDLSIFKHLEPHQKNEIERFTPSTITLLGQDPESKAITPMAIRVCGANDRDAQIYLRDEAAAQKQATDSAWLYALQAAKASVTVYGVWLGHVYQWHIVTAAMQITMQKNLPKGIFGLGQHAISKLLAPQSDYLIAFDTLLLERWENFAPPTSINSTQEFLQLCNVFAEGREFFDDDPLVTLKRLGLEEADFTKTQDKPWELYPIVPYYLELWQNTADYVDAFVSNTYKTDNDIKKDGKLQDWIKFSTNTSKIKGLPAMQTKQALKEVLTSLIYRITMHGVSRFNSEALPAFTFVANFPPCLQSSRIPEPSEHFDTKELLSYLPKTGTIGGMLTFYFLFVFTKPYKSFIPSNGIDKNLFFGSDPKEPGNQALITYRNQIKDIALRIGVTPQVHQWPLNIET